MLRRRRLAWCFVVACVAVGLLSPVPAPASATDANAGIVPAGFSDTAVIDNLVLPTAAAFAPTGRVFIAEKSGIVKTYDSVDDTTATIAADLRDVVYDFWDRGLLGIAVHPDYPAEPYLYALYSYDQKPGGGQWGDDCPDPPGANGDGCVIPGRLSRIALDANGVATGGEQVLITGWCQQYPSHSIGTVTFGPDGALYVGGGDGASFTFTDYGQVGNPCGDPPGTRGTGLSLPDARGGTLRSQSPRRPAGEPVSLDGAILRVNPETGAGLPGNPFAAGTHPNKRRIIAYGMRNQFRFGFRPGTDELWVGDVGWHRWEEINRIPAAADSVAENFGWPCYEGVRRQPGYDDLDLTACESLYTGAGQTKPYYTYHHKSEVVAGDGCPVGGSSISGIAFEDSSDYPAAYRGALFFADSSRGCIWTMPIGSDGQPDRGGIRPFAVGVVRPVQLLIGPDGDLFYIALDVGQLRRISYGRPTAVASADPTSGDVPLTVHFDGTASSDPDGHPLSYAWDLDADGAFDDAFTATAEYTYTTRDSVRARLRVTDSTEKSDVDTVIIAVADPPDQRPVATIDDPAGDLTWRVNDRISFSGHATDPQEELTVEALNWQVTLNHCYTTENCHSHPVKPYERTATGTFIAPDHEYPSSLEITLTATDSDGNQGIDTVELYPQTVPLDFASTPTGMRLRVNDSDARTPFSRTAIIGSRNSVSAPSPQGAGYWFTAWSDGGARSHEVVAPESRTTYRASYLTCTVGGVKQSDCGGATPSAVRDLASFGGLAKARLTWRNPYWPGVGGVTKYRIRVDGEFARDIGAGVRSTVLTGLAARRSHTFGVIPYSASGAGRASRTTLIGTGVRSWYGPATITLGDTVRIGGSYTRTDTGAPLPGVWVRLVRRSADGGWTHVAWQQTNGAGTVVFHRKPDLSREFRLLYHGNGTFMGVASARRPVTVG